MKTQTVWHELAEENLERALENHPNAILVEAEKTRLIEEYAQGLIDAQNQLYEYLDEHLYTLEKVA
jgi:hypothetical protein